jgi:hypothetical protein
VSKDPLTWADQEIELRYFDLKRLEHVKSAGYRTYREFLDAPIDELCKIKGIGRTSAVWLKAYVLGVAGDMDLDDWPSARL